MFKKILLLICIAFVVVCYGYPFFALPFGEYTGEIGSGESKVEVSFKFAWDGKVECKYGELENEAYYKVKGDEIILYSDEKHENEIDKMKLNSMYSIDTICELTNNIGMYMAIGVGVLAIVLVLLPSKR